VAPPILFKKYFMAGPGKALFIDKIFLTKDTIEMKFKALGIFDFTPGQFINIKIDDKKDFPCFRGYSISGYDRDKNEFDLCVKLHEFGRGSNYLKNLQNLDEIMYIGPSGNFLIDSNNEHVFMATGTGIAPIKTMIEKLILSPKNKLILIIGFRFEEDIIYKEYFQSLAKKNANFQFVLTISKPNESWTGHKGRITEIINSTPFPYPKASFYLCGNPEMVLDAEKILIRKGLNLEKIHSEKF
jgi:NAD(P)H-flavin reductase